MRKDFVPVPYESEFHQSILLDKILTERGVDERTCAAVEFKYESPTHLKTVAEIAHSLAPLRIFQIDTRTAIAEFPDKNFAVIQAFNERDDFRIKAFGDYDWIIAFRATHAAPVIPRGSIRWFYSHKGDIESRSIDIESTDVVHDAFYPFLDGGVNAFFDAYFASRASILILMGPPGTGKTSLLRHLLCSRNLTAAVTFDETVMADEEYFINFATDANEDFGPRQKKTDLMVIEDADLILSSRESDQNKIMSKLLNVSEGLIPLHRKKMIFTTNLPNINRIDPALVRPGRCFQIINFRPLTIAEAAAAAKVAGLPFDATGKKEVTLAEIFNEARKSDEIERFKLLRTA